MLADTTPLRDEHFRRLWVANIITVIGAQLTVVAVPAQIYAETGSSAYVECSVVVYSNEAKTQWLGVPGELIAAHGAVSELVAVAMAGGIRERAGVEIGVGITGIAGPTGGSSAKPVGTVCIAVVTPDERLVRTFRFPGNRELVKTFSAFTALDMVRRLLVHVPPNVDWNEKI